MQRTVSKSGCTPQSVLEELRNSVLRYDDPLEPVAQDSHAELVDRLVQQHQARKKSKNGSCQDVNSYMIPCAYSPVHGIFPTAGQEEIFGFACATQP